MPWRRRNASKAGKREGSVVLPALPEEEKAVLSSLQIGNDVRYDAMEHYTKHGGTADTEGHFARICAKNRRMHGLQEEARQVEATAGFDDIAAREHDDEMHDGNRILRIPGASVNDRVDWQESFDRSVKRLFVDFELTQAPGCRLGHLDRMHAWFQEHGGKTTRKSTKGPSYLMMDPKGAPLPGSTKNLPPRSPGGSTPYGAFASPFRSPCLSARGRS